MKEFYVGNVRIQFFSEEILRLEYGKAGKFCDENTFFIPDKAKFGNYSPELKISGGSIAFGEYILSFLEGEQGLSGIMLFKGGSVVYKYKRILNCGELPPPERTPEVFAVSDNPRIIVPDGGYTYHGNMKNSGYGIEENVQDVYLILCGGDAKKLRKAYVELTGRSELVRLSTLGSWNSKYYEYNQETAKQLILDYEKYGIPLDNMVIDTDWRKTSDRGIGYDINEELFPDMKEFFDFAHAHGVEIMFNDHPEPADGATSVLHPAEVKFREEKLTNLLNMGLDYWWYDRNWCTKLISPVKGLEPETWGMYLFADITENNFKAKAKGKRAYRRPVIMGNVNNVKNGCYTAKDECKIRDTASHRYSIQWTGDTPSDLPTLSSEVKNMLKVGDNCVAYINSDCGGHFGNPDREEYIYWVQYGVFSPVFRPHCTKNLERMREPWVYDEETLKIATEYIKMRYRLLPVIYKNAYNDYLTGEPIFKSLAYGFPDDAKASKLTHEYMLGNNILVSPVCATGAAPLGSECYAKPVSATYFDGVQWKGAPIYNTQYDVLDKFWQDECPHAGVPAYNFSAIYETVLNVKARTELLIESDDGVAVWINGKIVHEDLTEHAAKQVEIAVLEPDENYEVKINYFQAGGSAKIALLGKKPEDITLRNIYLPRGEWIDLFDGKIYRGPKSLKKHYDYKTLPLFVRRGALIPLACDAKNTKEQKWNKLVYDFYPSRNSRDDGYLYEDDTITTAYKYGEFRKCAFNAYYNESNNRYEVNLFKADGCFEGEKCFKNRKIAIKYHVFDGDKVKKVLVNGESVKFTTHKRDKSAMPFSPERATDGGTVIVKLKIETDKDYKIEFCL